MPTTTYTALANVTLASAVQTVTFSNIPATYRDLILVANGLAASTAFSPRIRFNGDAAANYLFQRMSGSGTSATAGQNLSVSGIVAGQIQATSTSAIQCQANIMDYATSNRKSVLVRWDNTATGSGTEASCGRWDTISAITSVSIGGNSSGETWAIGSTFALYGVIA